jgi:hypothetical protein
MPWPGIQHGNITGYGNVPPGRARTANLVINSSSKSYLLRKKLKTPKHFTGGRAAWMVCLSYYLYLPDHEACKMLHFKSNAILLTSCDFMATENLLNRYYSRRVEEGWAVGG